jgi:hypothetical protein
VKGIKLIYDIKECYNNTLKALEANFGERNKTIWRLNSVGECTFTGDCFNFTSKGTSCVGENPNDL